MSGRTHMASVARDSDDALIDEIAGAMRSRLAAGWVMSDIVQAVRAPVSAVIRLSNAAARSVAGRG